MLEKLPDVIGHALRGQRAGLDKTAFRAVDLRGGMAVIAVTSLAFADHAPIPERYTADGAGLSPPLQWAGVPSQASSLVVLVEDADSPTPQPLVHAIVVELPAADGGVGEGALPSAGHLADGFKVGRNSYLQAAWLPPIPRRVTACTAMYFRSLRSKPAPRSTTRPGGTPCSRRSSSMAWQAAASSGPTSGPTRRSPKGSGQRHS